MNLLLKLAWRNLWRNKRRTLITAAALWLALVLMILYTGLMRGMTRQLQQSVTRLTVGDFQIHHKNYLQELSLYDTVPQAPQLLEKLQQQGFQAAPRWYGYGLISNSRTEKSAGVHIEAIEAQLESQVTELHLKKNLLHGEYLNGQSETVSRRYGGVGAKIDLTIDQVVLAKKVAEQLQAVVGDELVLVTSGADGSIGNELVRVVGVLKNISEVFDRTRIILNHETFERLFAFPEDQAHEIAIHVPLAMVHNDPGIINEEPIRQKIEPLLAGSSELRSWRQVVPLVADIVLLVGTTTAILTLIIYISAAMVILNSILMMVFERLREFGVMKALGYSPRQIVMLVLTESAVLTFIVMITGWLVGFVGNSYLVHYGLDLATFAPNGFDFSGATVDPVMHSVHEWRVYLQPTIILFCVTLLSAIYPAVRAAKTIPVKAIYGR